MSFLPQSRVERKSPPDDLPDILSEALRRGAVLKRRGAGMSTAIALPDLLDLSTAGGRSPVDLLTQAIDRALPMLTDPALPIGDRRLVFRCVLEQAEHLAAWDVVEDEFERLAIWAGLVDIAPAIEPETEPETEPESNPYGAANVTVEALMLGLRERGVDALAESNCQRRLADLSTAQVRKVIERLIKLRQGYPAISDDVLLKLGRQL
jgi:hypothetical protein